MSRTENGITKYPGRPDFLGMFMLVLIIGGSVGYGVSRVITHTNSYVPGDCITDKYPDVGTPEKWQDPKIFYKGNFLPTRLVYEVGKSHYRTCSQEDGKLFLLTEYKEFANDSAYKVVCPAQFTIKACQKATVLDRE